MDQFSHTRLGQKWLPGASFEATFHSGSLASSLVLIPATATLGSFLSQLVTFSAEGLLGDDVMTQWGWRLPFWLALIPGSVAIWGRKRLAETSSFLAVAEATEKQSAAKMVAKRIWELVASYWPQVGGNPWSFRMKFHHVWAISSYFLLIFLELFRFNMPKLAEITQIHCIYSTQFSFESRSLSSKLPVGRCCWVVDL